jgi:hypothetical protein
MGFGSGAGIGEGGRGLGEGEGIGAGGIGSGRCCVETADANEMWRVNKPSRTYSVMHWICGRRVIGSLQSFLPSGGAFKRGEYWPKEAFFRHVANLVDAYQSEGAPRQSRFQFFLKLGTILVANQ